MSVKLLIQSLFCACFKANEKRDRIPYSGPIQADSPDEVLRLVNMTLKQFKEIKDKLNKNQSLLIGYLRSLKENKVNWESES